MVGGSQGRFVFIVICLRLSLCVSLSVCLSVSHPLSRALLVYLLSHLSSAQCYYACDAHSRLLSEALQPKKQASWASFAALLEETRKSSKTYSRKRWNPYRKFDIR